MNLYLMRHAEAVQQAASDAERSLTVRGRRQAQDIALQLKRQGTSITKILASPLRRAKETASLVAAGLAGRPVIVVPGLAAGVLPGRIQEWLDAPASMDGVLLVGHQPDLSMLAHAMGHASAIFSPADVCGFERMDNPRVWRLLFQLSASSLPQ